MIHCRKCGTFIGVVNRVMRTNGTLIYSPTGYMVYCKKCGEPNPCTEEGGEIS